MKSNEKLYDNLHFLWKIFLITWTRKYATYTQKSTISTTISVDRRRYYRLHTRKTNVTVNIKKKKPHTKKIKDRKRRRNKIMKKRRRKKERD